MPHFTRSFKLANTKQKKKRVKRRPFDAETLKPIKHATPTEIFGTELKVKSDKKSKKKS
tara:strand:- start:201 stop:377 length:177 start_codon:yes stop_codon:yes gene_type:complete